MLLLVYLSLTPANKSIKVYRWIHKYSKSSQIKMYHVNTTEEMMPDFYHPKNFSVEIIKNALFFKNILIESKESVYVFVVGDTIPDSLLLPEFKPRLKIKSNESIKRKIKVLQGSKFYLTRKIYEMKPVNKHL